MFNLFRIILKEHSLVETTEDTLSNHPVDELLRKYIKRCIYKKDENRELVMNAS